jgi:hypothetical protein
MQAKIRRNVHRALAASAKPVDHAPVVIPSKRSAARNLLSIHPPDAFHFSNADQ